MNEFSEIKDYHPVERNIMSEPYDHTPIIQSLKQVNNNMVSNFEILTENLTECVKGLKNSIENKEIPELKKFIAKKDNEIDYLVKNLDSQMTNVLMKCYPSPNMTIFNRAAVTDHHSHASVLNESDLGKDIK